MWSTTLFVLFVISFVTAGKYGSSGGRSGGSHSYPHSTGYSGNSNTYQRHSYPTSHGLSGNTHNYQSNTFNNHRTEVHHHYHYNPPQQISYGSASHPVYHAAPPVYVYEYRNSGSRFDNLLAGLALYNLGRMSASHHNYDHREYRGHPGEICKLRINKSNGEFEESRIDCKLMSSFIWEAETTQPRVESTNTVTTTVINNTISSNGTVVSTVENTKVVDALQVKGPSIAVTPGMNCFMIRISRDSSILQKKVECGLLQAYARNSLYYNGSNKVFPVHLALVFTIICLIMNLQ